MRAFATTDALATGIVILLAVGLALRRNRSVHPWIMGTAFVLDVSLVLYLELTRGAVATAAKFDSTILTVHVSVAVTTILLYLVLLPSGWRLLRGNPGARVWHRRAAILFVACRLATYFTAFFVPRGGG